MGLFFTYKDFVFLGVETSLLGLVPELLCSLITSERFSMPWRVIGLAGLELRFLALLLSSVYEMRCSSSGATSAAITSSIDCSLDIVSVSCDIPAYWMRKTSRTVLKIISMDEWM